MIIKVAILKKISFMKDYRASILSHKKLDQCGILSIIKMHSIKFEND